MKSKRQDKIVELITQYPIETQEELIAKLADAGFNVTQATISRDIRELKISKVSTGKGGYKYTLTQHEEFTFNTRLNAALSDSVMRVENAMNIVMIHTLPGLAPAVASGIDSMEIPSYLGCVAGADTIMLVFTDFYTAEEFKQKFKSSVNIS